MVRNTICRQYNTLLSRLIPKPTYGKGRAGAHLPFIIIIIRYIPIYFIIMVKRYIPYTIIMIKGRCAPFMKIYVGPHLGGM